MRPSSPDPPPPPKLQVALQQIFGAQRRRAELTLPHRPLALHEASQVRVQAANAGAKPASAADGRPVHKAAQQSKQAEEPASALMADGDTCQEGAAAVEFQVSVKELASRFTQATNELQLMGIVRAATSKRRGSFAQRLVWGTGRVTGGSVAAV